MGYFVVFCRWEVKYGWCIFYDSKEQVLLTMRNQDETKEERFDMKLLSKIKVDPIVKTVLFKI
ncbi:hypothetical protein Desku_2214 [Desulfofundulus kuznetsovii DSM 6115]|uniref:Uncharacterized protein n=1 Tax=Desulfofundulus kuznetsovii (strain DSM 6115 / VKM B-1805 / 17) TaxID=760568 RepID=A0AAU8PCJ7_DESK7|nr:hypothetical protein Desku_2214 [Desulfofundulus kuznetsovii DSM 6115]